MAACGGSRLRAVLRRNGLGIFYLALGVLVLLSDIQPVESERRSYSKNRSKYRNSKLHTYVGTKWIVRKSGEMVHERVASKDFYNSKKSPRSRGLSLPVYSAYEMGYYYSTFYSMYYTYGSSLHYKNRGRIEDGEECYNDERLLDNATMGKFNCPLPFEPEAHKMCCGKPFMEFCCKDWSPTPTEQLLYASIGLGLALALLVLFYCLTQHGRTRGWGFKYNVDFWKPRRLKIVSVCPAQAQASQRAPQPQAAARSVAIISSAPEVRPAKPRIPTVFQNENQENRSNASRDPTEAPSAPVAGSSSCEGYSQWSQTVFGMVDSSRLASYPNGATGPYGSPPLPAYDGARGQATPGCLPPSYTSLYSVPCQPPPQLEPASGLRTTAFDEPSAVNTTNHQ